MDFPPVIDTERLQRMRVAPGKTGGSGFFSPIVVNVLALLIIALFIFILWRRFQSKRSRSSEDP